MLKTFGCKSMALTGLLASLLTLATSPALADDNVVLQRTTLLEKPVQLPGNSVNAKVIHVSFPPAFKTPLHTHEGPGPRYIIAGKLKVVDKSGEKTYTTGQVFWETGEQMTIENIGQTSAEVVIFEMAPMQ